MSDIPYSNRELDGKFKTLEDKLDLILEQAIFTNGKVRKIILALSIIGGVLAGLMGKEVVIPLLMSFV